MTPFDHLLGKYVLVHSMPTTWTGRVSHINMCGGSAYVTLDDAGLCLAGSPQELHEPLTADEWAAAAGGIKRSRVTVMATAMGEIPGPHETL